MKPLLSAGVIAMAVSGVSAYAVTAVIAEANLRMGTIARNPLEAVQKGLTAIKTDRRTIAGVLALANSWRSDSDRASKHSSEETSDSVSWPVALLQAGDADPAKGAFVACKATFRYPGGNSEPQGEETR